MTQLKKTALHKNHIQLGAKMTEFAGFEMPLQYEGLVAEHMAVRTQVGIFDVSHMGEFVVRGPQAKDLIQWIGSNDVFALANKQAQYSCLPNWQGGIVDDLIVYKWDETEYYLVVNAGNIQKDWDWINLQKEEKKFDCTLENISDQLGLIAVQGPKAKQLVQELSSIAVEDIPFYHFEAGKIGEVEDVIISNTGYTGAGGFELYVWNKDLEKVWDLLLRAGKKYKIQPCGLGARDSLRLEMGFCLYGNDIHDHSSPIEAKLAWITKFNHPFVNWAYHKKLKEDKPAKRLTAFVMSERGIPRKGYAILDEQGNPIGEVSSGIQSPVLKKGIGLGYVKTESSQVGKKLHIAIRNKRIPAEVVKLPFI